MITNEELDAILLDNVSFLFASPTALDHKARILGLQR
jgi:hypothetical protein